MQSPGFSGPEDKKVEKEKAATSKAKLCIDKPTKPVPDSSRSAKASTDARFAELNQKWSDRFNRLEALLLTTTLDKEPTIQTVRVAPTHSPPAGAVKSTEPFIRLTDQHSTQSTPTSADLHRTDYSASRHQSTGKSRSDLPKTD